MKYALLTSLLTIQFFANAQKKLIPVTQSALTGISLPAGTKQDKRFLSEASAKALLEIESKKAGADIKNTEVFYLPAVSVGNFTDDSLVTLISNLGWNIAPVQGDNKFVWLQKDGRSIITYFSMDKKETQLYFGESATAPNISMAGTNNPPSNNNTTYSDPTPPPVPTVQSGNPVQTPPPAIVDQSASNSSVNNGITISTTNFDDGWSATPEAEWVKLKRNEFSVFLHYAISLPDDLRSSSVDPILDYFWNLLIAPRYNFQTVAKRPFETSYNQIYFMEADVTDKSSGASAHVGFRIYINSGIASCVEIVAPSKSSYDSQFPDVTNIDPLPGYNKFAITLTDIMGEWKESSGGFAQYYNMYSGNYAGMYGVSIASQLFLNTDETYRFEHKGASGMAGSQTFFSEKYAGKYSVNGYWTLTLTENDGKISEYTAFYKAVKNGRVLYLQNKKYSGQEYYLVKTK